MRDTRTDGALAPWVIQIFGMLVIVVSLGVFVVTHTEPIAIVGVAGGFVVLSGGVDRTLREVRKSIRPPDGDGEP